MGFRFEIDANQRRRWVVEGEYQLRAKHTEDGEVIEDNYTLRITYPPNYPERLPVAHELDGKVRDVEDHDHLLIDESLCLEVTPEKYIRFKSKGENARAFYQYLLDPYLYRNSYLRKNRDEPYPGRATGLSGRVQWMREYFQIDDTTTGLKILLYIVEYGYHRQNDCPCGSGEKIRNCHKDQIQAIKNLVPKDIVITFIRNCLSELENKSRTKMSED